MTQTAELMGSIAQTVETLQQAAQTCVDVKQELEDNYGGLKNTVDQALEKADSALPLTGGELTGMINYKTSFDYSNPPESTRLFRHLYKDVDGKDIGYCGVIQYVNNENVMSMFTVGSIFNEENVSPLGSELATCVQANGVRYAIAPHPRANNYGSDLVTMKTMKDFALQKQTGGTGIFLDAVNGSDTADLNTGRGLSKDKPFKTLPGLLAWVQNSIANNNAINILLLSDITVSSRIHVNYDVALNLTIKSDDTNNRKKINFTQAGNMVIWNGRLLLQTIDIVGNNTVHMFTSSAQNSPGASIGLLTGCKFSGSATTVFDVLYGSKLCILSDVAVENNITGKKYVCQNGGMIIGASKVPGSEAGTVDANSKAFG